MLFQVLSFSDWAYRLWMYFTTDHFASFKPSDRKRVRLKRPQIAAYAHNLMMLSSYQLHSSLSFPFTLKRTELTDVLSTTRRSYHRITGTTRKFLFSTWIGECLTRSLTKMIYFFLILLGCIRRVFMKFKHFFLYLYVVSTFSLSLEVDCHMADSRSQCFHNGPDSSVIDFESTFGTMAYVDNCANTHICNDRSLFIDYTPVTSPTEVDTIGGSSSAIGVGTVRWSWKDDLGHIHTYDVQNVKHFPDSKSNILSSNQLGIQFGDSDRGTTIESGIYSSTFRWDNRKYSRTIPHAANYLPSLKVDEHRNIFSRFLHGYRSFHQANSSSAFLSTSEVHEAANLNADSFLLGDAVLYEHADGIKNGIVISCLEPDYPTIQLDDGSTHHVSKDLLKRDVQHYTPMSTASDETDGTDSSSAPSQACQHPENTLSPEQQEMLRWHHRLLHLPFQQIRDLAQKGFLPKFLSKVKLFPPCAACIFGKSHKRPWRTSKKKGSIRKDNENFPGACVSVDHLHSHQPGLIPQQTGKLTKDRITGAVVFTDHHTGYTFVHLVTELTGAQTVEAKVAFELHAQSHGVKVLKYRADNGRFGDELFVNHCKKNNQTIDFCAVGAHHQNGIVERVIRDLTDNARTILLHGIRMWPEYITVMLWPYALRLAAARKNHLTLNRNGMTPIEQFSRTSKPIEVEEFHTFGAPIFVLDARQQSANITIPKWDPKTRLGVYLGFSPYHASSVALVLNSRTGLVSPQFHVTFDDDFSTLPYIRSSRQPPHWEKLVKHNSHLATDEYYKWSYNINSDSLDDEGEHSATNQNQISVSEGDDIIPSLTNRNPVQDHEGDDIISSSANQEAGSEHEGDSLPTQSVRSNKKKVSFDLSSHENSNDIGMPHMINLQESGLRRSSRTKKVSSTLKEATDSRSKELRSLKKTMGLFTMMCFTAISGVDGSQMHSCANHIQRIHDNVQLLRNVDGTINDICPIDQVLSGIVDNEVYTFRDAMRQSDRKEFIEAMTKEVNDHHDRGHWKIVKRAEMNFPKTIQAVWSFKRKRHPDGSLNKHKARLCAHGGMQQWGVNYWETFSPVVNWMSVRLVLTMSLMFDLETRSIDFVLAFPQADLDVPVFMELPMGMEIPGAKKGEYILELKKSLYGLKQAGLNWYEKLKKGLEDRGFKASDIDPCIFIRHDMIIISYVDDCCLISFSKETIDEFLKDLGDGPENFVFTDDGDIKNYLGVEFSRNGNQLEMKQQYLIQRIIGCMNFDETSSKAKDNPIIKPMLNRDIEGDSRKHDWNYRSVIGMLNYLEKTTRPDLSVAVHQCARFCENPKRSHEKAVHRIVKYLMLTKNDGLLFTPDPSRGIECFVDADFAGNWDTLDPDNAANMISRTGYVIFFMGCPLVWKSKLQTEISLSTTEAEYIALSQAMREVIPLMGILRELEKFKELKNVIPTMKCTVFEDNQSCIKLAKAPRMNPRTKYIALKYHHFRSHVKQGLVDIEYVDTHDQIADIFTKPLSSTQFRLLRKKLCGW